MRNWARETEREREGERGREREGGRERDSPHSLDYCGRGHRIHTEGTPINKLFTLSSGCKVCEKYERCR